MWGSEGSLGVAQVGELLEHTAAFVFVKDTDGRYRYGNRACTAAFGDVVGRRDEDVFGAPTAAVLRANDERVLAGRRSLDLEEAIGDRLMLSHKVPLFDERGEPLGVLGIATDITERNRRETQLAEAEAIARLGSFDWDVVRDELVWSDGMDRLLGPVPESGRRPLDRVHPDDLPRAEVGWWEWDAATGEMLWSQELYRILGTGPEHFTPSFENADAHVHEDDRERLQEAIAATLGERVALDVVHGIRRIDGSIRWVHARGMVCESGRMLGTTHDVTDVRRGQDGLRTVSALLDAVSRAVIVRPAERILDALVSSVGSQLGCRWAGTWLVVANAPELAASWRGPSGGTGVVGPAGAWRSRWCAAAGSSARTARSPCPCAPAAA
jgi:PAS domain S-box-containing protein